MRIILVATIFTAIVYVLCQVDSYLQPTPPYEESCITLHGDRVCGPDADQ